MTVIACYNDSMRNISSDHHFFIKKCCARLEQGAAEYGDKSFYAKTASLINDIDEELMDVANWSAILATSCEDKNAIVFLRSLARFACEMSTHLQDEAKHGTFEKRYIHTNVGGEKFVERAKNFLQEAIDLP